jgi:hypothetical protein
MALGLFLVPNTFDFHLCWSVGSPRRPFQWDLSMLMSLGRVEGYFDWIGGTATTLIRSKTYMLIH